MIATLPYGPRVRSVTLPKRSALKAITICPFCTPVPPQADFITYRSCDQHSHERALELEK
jgi:hypothetical protein